MPQINIKLCGVDDTDKLACKLTILPIMNMFKN